MVALDALTLDAHVVTGFVALFAGAVAIVTKKGGDRHRLAGRIYVYSMTMVAATSLLLYAFAPTENRLFLAMVAVFSYYFVFSGYRVLSRKRPRDAPATADLGATVVLTLAGVGLVAIGTSWALDGRSFATVILVFGGIGSGFGVYDLRAFQTGNADGGAWIEGHIVRMGAGYIATLTAFSTVNFYFLPAVGRWLWPTLVGSPLIAYAVSKYGPES